VPTVKKMKLAARITILNSIVLVFGITALALIVLNQINKASLETCTQGRITPLPSYAPKTKKVGMLSIASRPLFFILSRVANLERALAARQIWQAKILFFLRTNMHRIDTALA
jgi:hypothetical protein